MDEELKVNDGNGLYDSSGLIDSIIVDVNESLKELLSGQYIRFCSIVTQISQKLIELQSGLKADLESKDRTIKELTDICDELTVKVNELEKRRGGDE